MGRFQNTVTINRTVEEVFAFLAEFENVPTWNDAIEQTIKTSPGPVAAGATYRQIRSIPRRAEEEFEVTLFEPPSRVAIRGQIGPYRTRSTYVLEPVGSAARLTNDVDLEPSSVALRFIAPLAIPRVRAAVAGNLGNLKQLLEREQGDAGQGS